MRQTYPVLRYYSRSSSKFDSRSTLYSSLTILQRSFEKAAHIQAVHRSRFSGSDLHFSSRFRFSSSFLISFITAPSKMVTKKILIIATSQTTYPNTDEPTGLWLEELASPYLAFKEAGYEVDVVSIKGGKIPLDPTSLQPAALTEEAKKFQNDATLKKILEESGSVKDVKGDYDAVFLPGGHGVVFDVAYDKDTTAIVEKHFAAGKVVSAVCHGPGGLVEAKTPSGEPIVKGKKVAGFSNAEEEAVGKTNKVPYPLETALRNLGGIYSSGENWSVYAVADGNLVTGQNPQSSAKVAELVLKALE